MAKVYSLKCQNIEEKTLVMYHDKINANEGEGNKSTLKLANKKLSVDESNSVHNIGGVHGHSQIDQCPQYRWQTPVSSPTFISFL